MKSRSVGLIVYDMGIFSVSSTVQGTMGRLGWCKAYNDELMAFCPFACTLCQSAYNADRTLLLIRSEPVLALCIHQKPSLLLLAFHLFVHASAWSEQVNARMKQRRNASLM